MDDTWTIGQLIFGIVMVAAGFMIVWKADWMYKNFGVIPFAEKYLATEGGTRLFYKLIGILIITGGFMHATGLLKPFVLWAVRAMFGGYFKTNTE